MPRVYANLRIFTVLFALMLLASCSGGSFDQFSGYNTPWRSSPISADNSVVTDDPDKQPDIAWQTSGQRTELARQSTTIDTQIVAAPVPAGRVVKVSLLLPLSGARTEIGQSMLKSAQMALFDVGSTQFELIPRDTKSTPAGAAAAAAEAVAASDDLILGPIFADDLKAVKPVVRGQIPIVSFTTDWTLGDRDTYIMGFLPFPQVTRVARYAQHTGSSRFAVYAPQTEYCDIVIRTLREAGVSIVNTKRYTPQQPDLNALVDDFAETTRRPDGSFDFDTLMLPLGGEGLKSLAAMLDRNGIHPPEVRFIGTGLWDDAGLTSTPPLYGGLFAGPDPALRRDFERRFQRNFGIPAPRLASLSYDATALAAVLSRTGGPMPYSRANLTNPRGFAGIDGIFRFRPDGLSERGLAVLEINAGRIRVVDPAPTAFVTSGS